MKNFVMYVGIFLFGSFTPLLSQSPKKWTSGDIYQGIEKLNFLGSVLYIAAHPDDENTRLISYMANSVHAQTTYLSLTRGDGGQNLIGLEINELLGALRTQELLMARSVDNGKQMFTRANDFGYSKNAEETIEIWDTEKVKADVIWAIRNTRPDVIINRFDHRTSGETHGHHTASAQLSHELFDKASDSNMYPEQLKYVKTWQPKRLFFNTSWWFYGSEDKFKKADKSALMSVDVGVFYTISGKSNTEIAAESRSKHKCQGFGSTGTRGSQLEYLELLKGDMPPGKENIFAGINTTWTRVKGGEEIGKLIDEIKTSFNFNKPHLSVGKLVNVYQRILSIDDEYWKKIKSEEVKDLIIACSGLFMEAKTNVHKVAHDDNISIDIEATNRSEVAITLQSISGQGFAYDTVLAQKLGNNETFTIAKNVTIANNLNYTAPYWLLESGSLGMYKVDDQSLIGKPITPHQLQLSFDLEVEGVKIRVTKDVVHKFNSPENGETYRPLEIVPKVSLSVQEPVYVFANEQPKTIEVKVTAWVENLNGKIVLPLDKTWKVTPEFIPFTGLRKGETKTYSFEIVPPKNAQEIYVNPQIIVDDKKYNYEMVDITYPHIPYQTILRPAKVKLNKLDIKIGNRNIAYLMGAGDDVPTSLKQIGYTVNLVDVKDISPAYLQQFNALVIGVRAYNTIPELKYKHGDIMEYVKQGGTVVTQYNTSNNLVTKELGPFPFELSRKRVSVETAPITIIDITQAILQTPNKIGPKDFDGWVQERGLYFPSEWSKEYQTLLSSNDPNEEAIKSIVLYAKHGSGHFVYTGLSFFRELPAGVSGAYRLFANMISLGSSTRP